MSGFKSFAIAGAGGLGKFIAEALIAKKNEGVISSVRLLSRSASGHDDLVAKGAKVVAVDYTSQSSIQSALSGVDVVISTLSGEGFAAQEPLAIGSKAAGVKFFVPSEFGNATDGITEGVWGQKDALKKKLKNEIKLPYAAFYTGGFTDYVLSKGFAPAIGFDLANGKIVVAGVGDAPISWTTRADIGRYVAHVLTALPKDKLEWRTFRIEGDRISFNQIAQDWKARSGKEVAISNRPRKELEDAIAKNPADFVSILLLEWDKGNGVSGKPEEITNNDFPNWNPKKVIDVLQETFGQ